MFKLKKRNIEYAVYLQQKVERGLCGCPLMREHKQKKNPIFILKRVRFPFGESACLREFVDTEFHRVVHVKRGIENSVRK